MKLHDVAALCCLQDLLPDSLLQVSDVVKDFTVYDVAGTVSGSVPLLLVIYGSLFLLMLPMLYFSYRRAEAGS